MKPKNDINTEIEIVWQEIIDAQRKLDTIKTKYINLVETAKIMNTKEIKK